MRADSPAQWRSDIGSTSLPYSDRLRPGKPRKRMPRLRHRRDRCAELDRCHMDDRLKYAGTTMPTRQVLEHAKPVYPIRFY
ncbi:hypothetical protein WS68_24805 [Burkholderia sp. TSV86]|nr:hypothetical protein WS68_24805 [Burkholderia sp. TSV86]